MSIALALGSLTADEKRGLVYALVASLIFNAILLWGTVPADGFLLAFD